MKNLYHLADKVLNRPLLLMPEKAQVIFSVLSGRLGFENGELNLENAKNFEANRFEGTPVLKDEFGRIVGKPFQMATSNIAVITIDGSLVQRGAWIGAYSGLISYEGLSSQIKKARNDDEVEAVVLDINSGGGEAVGCFELAAQIKELSQQKNTVALVNGFACSAAYALASAANNIVTLPTGICGSIGVVSLHADYSKNMDMVGIKPTLIFAGAHKVDGNPIEPLSADVKSDIQKEIDFFYDMFLQTVASGRGSKLSYDAAKATEARTYIGQEAVKAGLADEVGTFETVLAKLSGALPRQNVQQRSLSMEKDKETALAGVPKADHEKAVAAARLEGEKIGAENATARFQAIIGNEKVKASSQRLLAACDLAAKAPNMSAEEIANFVAGNISEEKPSASASLANRLSAETNDPMLTATEQVGGEKKSSLLARAQARNGGINGRI